MKRLAVLIFLIFFSGSLFSQVGKIDSLKRELSKLNKPEFEKVEVYKALSRFYVDSRPDSAIVFGKLGLKIAQKYNAEQGKIDLLNTIAAAYSDLGDFTKSFKIYFKLRETCQQKNDFVNLAEIDNDIGYTFDYKGDCKKAIGYSKSGLKVLADYEALHLLKSNKEQTIKIYLYLNSGTQFMDLNQLDSAVSYLKMCYSFINQSHIKVNIKGVIFYDLGKIAKRNGEKELSLKYFRQAIPLSEADQDIDNLCLTYLGIADLYHQYKQPDSAKYYAKTALYIAEQRKFLPDKLKASQALNRYFEEEKNIDKAYYYFKLSVAAKDSLFSQDKIRQLLALDFDERQRTRDVEDAKEKERGTVRFYFAMLGIAIFILIAFIFWRESRQRAKANEQLQKQQAELDQINQNLESMISERTSDLVDKNKKLYEYSYYLSHQIRGPVSTIKGLVNIEKEGLIEYHDFVTMVDTCAADIDNKITEINNILHERIEPLK